jgi:hypothetical protein
MEIRPELVILIVLTILGISYFIIQTTNSNRSCPSCPQPITLQKNNDNDNDYNDNDNDNRHYNNIHGIDSSITAPNPIGSVFHGDALRDFDRRAFSDPLAPPRKRNLHEPDYLNPSLAPIYTQGAPSPYRKVGTLKAVTAIDGSDDTLDTSAKYNFLYLMASKINSSQFNYYVTPTDIRDTIKFELTKKTEIYDGDYVEISTLDNQGYKVIMDGNALPLLVGIV